MTRPLLNRRLDGLGNSIFGVMSARAVATNSVNLGQGFPDVDGPPAIARDAADAVIERTNIGLQPTAAAATISHRG